MIDEKFINFINELANSEAFVELTHYMTESDKQQMKRAEIVFKIFLV